MSEDPNKCANCGQEKHTSELRRQLCQQEYLNHLMKKWAITALILTPSLFFIMTGLEQATAQEQITIWSGNTPMILPNENPVLIQQEVGSYLHGQIQGVFGMKCSLDNCLTETNQQGLSFSGTMPNYRAEIQTPENTIVFEPKQVDSGLPYGLTMTDIIMGLAVIGAIATLVIVIVRKRTTW